MDSSELLSKFSIMIYEPPLSRLRESGQIRDLSNPIAVAMLIVDFETEVSMNGMVNFIGNSTGLFVRETVAALKLIGCETQSAHVENILEIAHAAGMTHDEIQSERAGTKEFEVTTFEELHGDKWELACDAIEDIDAEIDYAEIMSRTEDFVGKHAPRFRDVLG